MRLIDADYILNTLPNDLAYKSSVKRVLICAPTVNHSKKIFDIINERLNQSEYEMENFINNCNDSDACADTQLRLDGLRYAMSIIDEIQEEEKWNQLNM